MPPGADPVEVADQLNRLPVVEIAEPQARPAPLPLDLSPPTPDLTGGQGYKGPAPGGVGALDPAAVPGGDGAGMSVVDVEYSWVLNHEDLELPAAANIDSATLSNPFPAEQGNHGTAVLGEIGGKRNGYGVTGITPGARMLVAPANTVQFGYSVARAISLATASLRAGDVILIEQQAAVCGGGCGATQVGCGPVEWQQPNFDAISTATALGIVVVQAAGNGNVDLDGPSCGGRFDRSVRDSGAIIVGAGAPGSRARLSFSSYGSRVDVQGWGTAVTTAGYGDAFDPGDVRQRYTDDFGGTSSASPIVTGAVLALQGALKARGASLASPVEMREALVATGTPQSGTGHIGPLPNTGAALRWLLDRRGLGGPSWKPFESVGGNLASFPECRATGVGQIDCWARGDGFALIWNRRTDGAWSGWRNLGGSLLSHPACLQRGARTHCVAVALDGALTQYVYDGSFWSAPIRVGGAYVARPSCVGRADGVSIDCFVVGTDKALRQVVYDGRSWKAPVRLGGSTTFRPQCQSRASGVDCYIIDAAGKLLTLRLSGGKPGKWVTVGGSLSTTPSCLVSGSVIDCFAQGRTGTLQTVRYNGRTWGRFTSLGGGVASQPACLTEAGGARSCLATTPDNRLVQFRSVGGRWQAPVNLGGSVQARPACLTSNGGARIDCFLQGEASPAMQQIAYY